LQRATQYAFALVTQFGMSEKVGKVGYKLDEVYQKPFSEQTNIVNIKLF